MSATILRFPRHRISVSALKPKTAASTRKRLPVAQPENTKKYSEGMTPAARQLLTAGGPTPSRLATAVVPPKASTMVSTDLSMPKDSSDSLNVSSVQIGGIDFSGIERINNEMDTKEVVGERIDVWLEAANLKAAQVCRDLGGLSPSAFSQWRRGVHLLPLDAADDLCRVYNLSLDWLYRGDGSNIPEDLRIKINQVTKLRKRLRLVPR